MIFEIEFKASQYIIDKLKDKQRRSEDRISGFGNRLGNEIISILSSEKNQRDTKITVAIAENDEVLAQKIKNNFVCSMIPASVEGATIFIKVCSDKPGAGKTIALGKTAKEIVDFVFHFHADPDAKILVKLALDHDECWGQNYDFDLDHEEEEE